MATTEQAPARPDPANPLIGSAPPSEAGPLERGSRPISIPASMKLSPFRQTLRFGRRPLPFLFQARRELGEVFAFRVIGREKPFVVTSHPDHVRSLFTAKPDLVPSITAESPLRPIVGPNSVLTANGPRHMRQRKLLLPPFHGEAIAQYTERITAMVEREVDSWQVGVPFSLAKRMQAVTLEVIMAGIFGIEGELEHDSPERRLRDGTLYFLRQSERPGFGLIEILGAGQIEPKGVMKYILDRIDPHYYEAIAARRSMPEAERGSDVLSLLLAATDEEGEGLSDHEIRDELVSLVLAGHETTANSLAWTFERLVRTPPAYDALRDAVRGGDGAEYVEATINEGMRVRPVIPMVGRVPKVDWQLGEYVIPAGTPISMAIALIHHRPDIYPEPYSFQPERFLGVKPGTYTWLPFGGGTRRCLGAALAMAEQRIVVETIARRVDLAYVDPTPEREQHRNVTLIPAKGGEVVVKRLLS